MTAERGACALDVLDRLDTLLAAALAAVPAQSAGTNRLRGLYVNRPEVERLLAAGPGGGLLAAPAAGGADLPAETPLGRLANEFELTAFDVDVVALALAPELDLRYERVFGYLHDDVTRRAPSVDLALNLLSASPEAKLRGRTRLAPGAPLIDHGLVRLSAPAGPPRPALAAELRLDELVVRHLLDVGGLDPRLGAEARIDLAPAAGGGSTAVALRRLAADCARRGRVPRLWAHGAPGSGRAAVAGALAMALGAPLLHVRAETPEQMALASRAARLAGTVLCVADAETVDGAVLAGHPGPLVLLARRAAPPAALAAGTVPIAVTVSTAARRAAWRAAAEQAGVDVDGPVLDALAERFRLGATEVRAAVAGACAAADWRAAADATAPRAPSPAGLFAAARARTGDDLAALATRITPRATWEDLVVPETLEDALRRLCERVALAPRVLEDWGLGAAPGRAAGLSALFAGASGTGKTLAAEVVAHTVGLDLFRIDLATVVSKYIGETEKNLARIFAAAEGTDAVLLFDEADALFGRRSEVRDSHDRYANIEVAYLLQRLEDHAGPAILATNLHENLDDAFLRRLGLTLHFPFPDLAGRRRLWERAWPAATPVAPDVDAHRLAEDYRITGASIRNIALAAAFAAAHDGAAVGMDHVRTAAARELRKLGAPEELPDGEPRAEALAAW